MMMMAIGDADNQKGVSIRKWTKGGDDGIGIMQRNDGQRSMTGAKQKSRYRYVRANTIQENGEGGGSSKSPCDSIAGKKKSDQGTLHKAECDGALAAPCAHLRAYVHCISSARVSNGHDHPWIMTQDFCQEACRHACQWRRRKWWLTRALCFLHQPLHRGAGSHYDRVHAHLAAFDPCRRVRTQ
jgi:hypothetical protein